MERRDTRMGELAAEDVVRVELAGLRNRDADLERRHELLVEFVAKFPNTVNRRQEHEVATARTEIATEINRLEEWLSRWTSTPVYA